MDVPMIGEQRPTYEWVVSYLFERSKHPAPVEVHKSDKDSAMRFANNIALEHDLVFVSVIRRIK